MKDPTPAADRLIVALDGVTSLRAVDLVTRLRQDLGVRHFKLSASNLTSENFGALRQCLMYHTTSRIMLDLKVWDTPDSVARIVRQVLGSFTSAWHSAHPWITVHPSVAKVALSIAPQGAVLPVAQLTSDSDPDLTPCGYGEVGEAISAAGAVVVPAALAKNYSSVFGERVTLVCPGVRFRGEDNDNHRATVEPRTAIEWGASHVVVGRPIVNAERPLSAAERYLKEMSL